jgi:hypothetical protein
VQRGLLHVAERGDAVDDLVALVGLEAAEDLGACEESTCASVMAMICGCSFASISAMDLVAST